MNRLEELKKLRGDLNVLEESSGLEFPEGRKEIEDEIDKECKKEAKEISEALKCLKNI